MTDYLERRYRVKKLGNVLYIMTEESYLHCENKSICVMVGGTEKTRIPVHTIEAIICLCNTSVSTPFIGFCGDNGISLSFHSDNGRFYGEFMDKSVEMSSSERNSIS